MKMVNLSHDCAPRHRKESGSQESCRFEKFRGDRFPGIAEGLGGEGDPESFLYVSTAARAVAAEGSPPGSPGGRGGRLRSVSAVYVGPLSGSVRSRIE